MNGPVASCTGLIGQRRSLLIVSDALSGVSRFDDFRARLGISASTLTRRLNDLVDAGVLERVPYQLHPPRSDYQLTEKGQDLRLVVTMMEQWEDRWTVP
ncbi:MAG TPA: helix-turn-helix domain-containing protein [Acidimicrobiales bacterium]